MKRLSNYYAHKKRLVEGFEARKEFLSPGSYQFDESMTYIHLDDMEISRKSKELFSQGLHIINFANGGFFVKTAVTKILRFYFNKKLFIDRKTKEADKGTVYLPAGNGKDVKIFDFSQKEVLITYSETEIFQQKLDAYSQFKNWFPIPSILDKDEKRKLIIERYIEYKSSAQWDDYDTKFIINEVFRRYLEYFKEQGSNGTADWVPAFEIAGLLPSDSAFLEEIELGISRELLERPLPMLPVHGDLWSPNILLDKEDSKKIYFIDWEMAGDMYFFYDFFVFMWNEAIVNKNYSFIRYYMEGEYDFYFEHSFELFNLEFDKGRKQEYLNIFFLNMYVRRWLDADDGYMDWIWGEYRKFMEYVISLDVLPDMPRRN
ncbi:aminoglycoside phosphotransferase family protein [Planococcus sp. MERTA32b]|nr:aminoglycoside phosphotransferase family protein [Planococcus sp. MER TA 32b]